MTRLASKALIDNKLMCLQQIALMGASMRNIFLLSAVSLSIFCSFPALCRELTRIIGEVKVGSLDSGIGDYIFYTDSKVGEVIFAACKMDEICDVRAVVNDDFIVAVASASLVANWNEPNLAAIEGWWGFSPEGCHDIEDNQYRVAVGRFDIQRNDTGPPAISFGAGAPGIGMYDGGCELGKLTSTKGGNYTFESTCEFEGEKFKGNVIISKPSKFTLNLKIPGWQSEGIELIACPKISETN